MASSATTTSSLLCKENTLSLDLSMTNGSANHHHHEGDHSPSKYNNSESSKNQRSPSSNSIARDTEELFVKTLSARSAASHQKPHLPTTPRGEGIVVSSPKHQNLQHLPQHDFDNKDTGSSVLKKASNSLKKTKFSQVELNRFDEMVQCDLNCGHRHHEMPYKNMTGLKLGTIDEMYRNYSKPIAVVPYVLNENEIIEKRLKKIKSTSPARSSKDFVKGDVLMHLTHDGDTNNASAVVISGQSPLSGALINTSIVTTMNSSVWTSPPSPIASLNSSFQHESHPSRNQTVASISDMNPGSSSSHTNGHADEHQTSPTTCKTSIKISANIPACNRSSFETTCSSIVSQNSPSNRCKSPNSTSPKNAWSKFTGGFYNSPRCFNTNYRHCSNPNFIRKNEDDESTLGVKKLGVESEKDPPLVRKRKEELHHIHQVYSVTASSESKRCKSNGHSTTFQRTQPQPIDSTTLITEDVKTLIDRFEKSCHTQSDTSNNDLLQIQATRFNMSPSPPLPGESRKRNKSSREDIEQKRVEEYSNPNTLHSVHSTFVPQFKPKRGSCTSPTFNQISSDLTSQNRPSTYQTSIRNDISISGTDKTKHKKHSILNYHDFDQNAMFIGDGHEDKLKQMLNPNNYPIDLFPQVEALRRRKNMSKSDYKNFNALRSSKLHTAYLCFRRSTINRYLDYKHQLENVMGKDKAPMMPHHLMDELIPNACSSSGKKKKQGNKREKVVIPEGHSYVSSEHLDIRTSLPEIVPSSNNQGDANQRNAVSFTL
nr:unnamed protein product [Naegleria fowleri]